MNYCLQTWDICHANIILSRTNKSILRLNLAANVIRMFSIFLKTKKQMVQETNLRPTYTQMAWQVAVLLEHLQAQMAQTCVCARVCVPPAVGMHAGPLQRFLEVNNSLIKKGHRCRPIHSTSRESTLFSHNRLSYQVAHYTLSGAFYCWSDTEME